MAMDVAKGDQVASMTQVVLSQEDLSTLVGISKGQVITTFCLMKLMILSKCSQTYKYKEHPINKTTTP